MKNGRLTIKARREAGELALCGAEISPYGTGWRSFAHIWDGSAPAFMRVSQHTTMNAAISRLHGLAEKYPPREDIEIIVDE